MSLSTLRQYGHLILQQAQTQSPVSGMANLSTLFLFWTGPSGTWTRRMPPTGSSCAAHSPEPYPRNQQYSSSDDVEQNCFEVQTKHFFSLFQTEARQMECTHAWGIRRATVSMPVTTIFRLYLSQILAAMFARSNCCLQLQNVIHITLAESVRLC